MVENMEEIYKQLNEENKEIINMIAKGIQIGQQNANTQIKQIQQIKEVK